MDCFYAQVEMRDRPELKNVPVAVGGLPGTRSVLCTSNYIARKYGVKSAMPTDYALRLCPDLIVIEPNFDKYSNESKKIQLIFDKYSKLVEPISLDEAYLDVSIESSATSIAKKIKNDIFEQTNLTASVGVANNKFLAKIASDWNKPNGLFVILPKDIKSFVDQLPVKLIPGIGKKGIEVMTKLQVKTCLELQQISKELLHSHFGIFSQSLINYAQGIDDRLVQNDLQRKSISVETTFLEDIQDNEILKFSLRTLHEELCLRIKDHVESVGPKTVKKIFVKVKFDDFSRTSCEICLDQTDDNLDRIINDAEAFQNLLNNCLKKKLKTVRLIGLGVKFKTKSEKEFNQQSLLTLCGLS